MKLSFMITRGMCQNNGINIYIYIFNNNVVLLSQDDHLSYPIHRCPTPSLVLEYLEVPGNGLTNTYGLPFAKRNLGDWVDACSA